MNKLRLQLKKLIKHINIFLILTNQQLAKDTRMPCKLFDNCIQLQLMNFGIKNFVNK